MNISNIIKEVLAENATYDKIIALKNWYEEERKKIDKTEGYKKFKYNSDKLFKLYLSKTNELSKKSNSYALAGDMNAKHIYHYTKFDALESILEDNMMYDGGCSDVEGISYTSNGNLYKRGFVFYYPSGDYEGVHNNNVGIKMKFDFNKMKADGLKFIKGSENLGTHAGEEELKLRKYELNDVKKYILEVIVFKNKEKKYKEAIELLNKHNIKNKLV
jgi:hypothetical protein